MLQVLDDLPAIDERLKFRRRAQVLEEIAALLGALEADESLEQARLRRVLLALGFVSIGFQVYQCINVLVHYYISYVDAST